MDDQTLRNWQIQHPRLSGLIINGIGVAVLYFGILGPLLRMREDSRIESVSLTACVLGSLLISLGSRQLITGNTLDHDKPTRAEVTSVLILGFAIVGAVLVTCLCLGYSLKPF